jgi:Na+-transporting methylmalonyl-CoA/oxaloacetate decarboxylase gamma subunit
MDHKENNASVFFFICLSVLITAVSFMPSLVNHFTNWDDNVYLLDNPAIRELSLRNIWNIFTSVKEDFYKPLVLLSYSIEYHFFKLDPVVYQP